MFRYVSTMTAAASLLLTPLAAYGWNRTGHRASALIAYRQLDEGTRRKVAAVLRKNPLARDLWGEPKITGVTDADADAFMNASTFPDDVRPPSPFSKAYHHSTHHYVNFGYVPNDPTRTVIEPPAGEESILTTYRANIATVKGTKAGVDDAARAIALCWIFHQLGDIHMPLHAVSRFSRTFPEGDRGGNQVMPFPNPRGSRPYSKNLHAYWDDLLGDDDRVTTFAELDRVVAALVDEFPRSRFTDSELKDNDIHAWAMESLAAARGTVYRNLDPETKGHDVLPPDYEEDAQKLARRRIALSSYRLAVVLEDLFGEETR